MITVKCTYLNPETLRPMNSLEKKFPDPIEFRKFYLLAKTDPCVILDVVFKYDPQAKPVLKDVYDARLLRLGRENPV